MFHSLLSQIKAREKPVGWWCSRKMRRRSLSVRSQCALAETAVFDGVAKGGNILNTAAGRDLPHIFKVAANPNRMVIRLTVDDPGFKGLPNRNVIEKRKMWRREIYWALQRSQRVVVASRPDLRVRLPPSPRCETCKHHLRVGCPGMQEMC